MNGDSKMREITAVHRERVLGERARDLTTGAAAGTSDQGDFSIEAERVLQRGTEAASAGLSRGSMRRERLRADTA